jgi:hypothetical protein
MRFLLILAIAAGIAYYAYKGVSNDEAPSCAGAQTACMQKCRRTTTENQEAQACQAACARERETCDREKARATQ